MSRKKLSFSSCTKYMQCPFGWNEHYNNRVRPIMKGSPLVHGSGIDEGFNVLLSGGTIKKAMEAYRKEVAKTPIGRMLPHKMDFDHELLTTVQIGKLLPVVRKFGYPGDNPVSLAFSLMDKTKAGEELSGNQVKAYDVLCRASLESKAELIFKAYAAIVLPKIKKVISIQKRSGAGKLDIIADWEDVGVAIVDNKTSVKDFHDNAVEFSAQLAMYADAEKINKAIYVVINKQIKKNRLKICSVCAFEGQGSHTTCNNEIDDKRCKGAWNESILPEVDIQIVHGEITPQAIEVVREFEESVHKSTEAKIFPCNVQECNSMFGKPCVYRDLKWKGSMEGLEVVPGGKENVHNPKVQNSRKGQNE